MTRYSFVQEDRLAETHRMASDSECVEIEHAWTGPIRSGALINGLRTSLSQPFHRSDLIGSLRQPTKKLTYSGGNLCSEPFIGLDQILLVTVLGRFVPNTFQSHPCL